MADAKVVVAAMVVVVATWVAVVAAHMGTARRPVTSRHRLTAS